MFHHNVLSFLSIAHEKPKTRNALTYFKDLMLNAKHTFFFPEHDVLFKMKAIFWPSVVLHTAQCVQPGYCVQRILKMKLKTY